MEEKVKKLKLCYNLNFKKIYQLKYREYNLYVLFFQLINDDKKDLVRYLQLLYITYFMNCSEDCSYEHFFYLIEDYSLEDVIQQYFEIFAVKRSNNFRNSFYRKSSKKIKVPKFELEDVEDYYTYYVLILNLSEELFWNSDFSFLLSVSANKSSYDSFISSERLKISEERR